MKIAMLAPIAWRTPPRHYGPWERVTSLLTEELIHKGCEVTLFATGDSRTRGELEHVTPKGYEEDPAIDPKVYECLHISNCFEQADRFDLIHNQFDFLPLSYSRLIKTPVLTTIHGFSSPKILPVFKKYNNSTRYVSISNADRSPELDYIATVYHGIDLENFTYNPSPSEGYLIYFGRIHHDKGTGEAIEIAKRCGMRLVIAGIIQDQNYYEIHVKPELRNGLVEYVGSAGPEKRDELLGNATALLHPINFNEPFGLSVVESMACGTPVIAFKKGSMAEILTDGKTGWLVDSIEEAVESVKKIHRIDRAACRNEVEKRFTKSVMTENYLKVYRQIIDTCQERRHEQ
jgi:glycosyltransferase involved in cell wall biosynthesis